MMPAGPTNRSDGVQRRRLVNAVSRRRARFGFLRHIGPGLITGAADDDPSGIGTYSQLGAQFRFAMLWTVPVSLPLAAAVEELAARLGLAGGEGLASLIKKTFPSPVMWSQWQIPSTSGRTWAPWLPRSNWSSPSPSSRS